jgi:uncharacterized membrane protein (UPF0136 family)
MGIRCGANSSKQSQPENSAFILALLTAGGGITGYARTGSVPSIAAGCTVGALVCFSSFQCLLLLSGIACMTRDQLLGCLA